MEILAFSDIAAWENYGKQDYHSRLVAQLRPDVTVLAGDIAFDGSTGLRAQALHSMPRYEREMNTLRVKGLAGKSAVGSSDWVKRQNAIVDRLQQTPDYTHVLKVLVKQHLGRFYEFLRFAGEKSTVLMVKGDHDDDYSPGYEPSRMEELGCMEISGKSLEIDGLVFLGLGFNEAHSLTQLRTIIEGTTKRYQRADIIVMHHPKSRLRMLAGLAPRIAIVGGAGPGEYLVDGVRTILSDSKGYFLELSRNKPPKVSRIGLSRRSRMMRKWFWHKHEESLFKTSDWLKPYREKVGFLKVQGPPQLS